MDNFRYGFEESFMDKLIDRMDQNQEISFELKFREDLCSMMHYILGGQDGLRIKNQKVSEAGNQAVFTDYFPILLLSFMG